MSSESKKRRRGAKISKDNFSSTFDTEISSHNSVELTILHLIELYDVDLDDLCGLLLEKGLDVSFSKVKYRDVAPRVGLVAGFEGKDMTTFDIHRARIPTSLFKDITQDIEIMMKQYGEPTFHRNVEAKSRFLAPLFNRTVALFNLTIHNVPGSIIQDRILTRGRIEHHFLVFGEVCLLVFEVKYYLGRGDERLNAIAQVIAECDACDYANDKLGLSPPRIYAVLCDGTSFEFFSFESSNPKPTFSRGVFRTYMRLSTADYHATSLVEYIRSLRPICETLFYFLLLTFNAGVEAFTTRSQESTPNWAAATNHAGEALRLAVHAAEKASDHDDTADGIVETALTHLNQSLAAIPATHKTEIDFMGIWNDEDFKFC